MGPLAAVLVAIRLSAQSPAGQVQDVAEIRGLLRGWEGVHPRLLANSEQFKGLIRQARTGRQAELAGRVIDAAEIAARGESPGTAPATQPEGPAVADPLPCLALAYRLTADQRFLTAAQTRMVAAQGPSTPAEDAVASPGAGLFGASLAYDWLYHNLDPQTQESARRILISRGRDLYQAVRSGRPWWHDAYLHPELWVNAAGLAACGLAVFEQCDEALEWIAWSRHAFAQVRDALGPDGAWYGSEAEASCGLPYLLAYGTLQRDLLDQERFRHPWLRSAGDYRLYATLPNGQCCIDSGDGGGRAPCSAGPVLRRLASEYRVGRWQWLAEQTQKASGVQPGWLDLLWYDPSVAISGPQALPLSRLFADRGVVFSRSDWDSDAVHWALTCGPPLGHRALRFGRDLGARSADPNAGSVALTCGADRLLADEGSSPGKRTSDHSTLLVDGLGQVGEGGEWFDMAAYIRARAEPNLIQARFTDQYDWCIADATSAYPAETGLRRFVRHVVFLRPDVLAVIDDLAAARPVPFELLYHAAGPLTEADDGYQIRSGQTVVALQRWATVPLAERIVRPGSPYREVLSLRTAEPVAEALVVVVLDIRRPSQPEPTRLSVGLHGDQVELSAVRAGEARSLTLTLVRPGLHQSPD